MLPPLRSMIQDESASTALEYGLLIASIAVVAIISVETFGWSVASLFGHGASRASIVGH